MEKISQVTITVDLEGLEEVEAGFASIGESASELSGEVSSYSTTMATNFEWIGDAGVDMGRKISESSRFMETNYRSLLVTSAGMIANSVQLADIMDRMASGQMSVGRGVVMLAMNFLQLAGQLYLLNLKYGEKIALQTTSSALDAKEIAQNIAGVAAEALRTAAAWARVAAETAKAIALGVVHALEGPYGWAILAGAAVAAAGVYAFTRGIPSREYGGPVLETKPYLLHVEEYVETPEERRNITEVLKTITETETLRMVPVLTTSKSVYISPGAIIIQEATAPRETSDAVIDGLRRSGVI